MLLTLQVENYELMIKKHSLTKLPIYLLLVTLMAVGYGCNSDSSEYEQDLTEFSGTAVKSFSLKANSKILKNLDSIFFSIDLNNGQIFNADSLPVGTDVSRMLVDISIDYAREVTLSVPRVNKPDTVLNFLENPNDSVDFSNGPVRLHVLSLNGMEQRDYMIRVNVHKMEPDSLYFNEIARRDLPSRFPVATITNQKTVKFKDEAYCLVARGTEYSLATTADPAEGQWQIKVPVFPVSMKVSSLTAAEDCLYILSNDGALYRSTDGLEWKSVGKQWRNITAAYGTTVLGVAFANGIYYHDSYPSSAAMTPAAEDFPVSGNSASVEYSTKWAEKPQIMIFGGVTAAGELTGASWAFDGSTWEKIGGGLPAGSDYTVTPYTICETDTLTWRTKKSDVLIAFGSRQSDGSIERRVYVSRNMGFDWKRGGQMIQLPEYLGAFSDADALVFNTRMTPSRSASTDWTPMPSVKLPVWYEIAGPVDLSRAVAPITEWECPYLYIFGGIDYFGKLRPYVWRGVVNSLTFKPLQ